MIVPMKKVSLVVLKDERRQALKVLRKTGVVHVEEVSGEGEELSSLKSKASKIELALSLLSEIKLKKSEKTDASLSQSGAFELADKIVSLAEEKKELFARISSQKTQLERYSRWGNINPEDFNYLAEKNIHLTPYEIPVDKYNAIGEEAETLLVDKDKNQARFLLISDHQIVSGENVAGLPPEAFRIEMPECSTKKLSAAIKAHEERIAKIDGEIALSAKYIPSLKKALKNFSKDIEFENLYFGMGVENDGDGSVLLKSSKLAWLTGFVPEDEAPKIEAAAKENKWAFSFSTPGDDDDVPTKLKNNKFVELIYPVTDFLGTIPGYREYDISNWFLLFFIIFFAMIFGDGGYGALLFLGGLAAVLMPLFKKQRPSAFACLLTILGFATMAWGVVTCTWFGIDIDLLPDFLKNLSVPALSNATSAVDGVRMTLTDSAGNLVHLTNEGWVKENLQIFCFSLALIQLSVAHLKGMIANFRSPKVLGDFGSLLQVCGMFYVVLSMVVDGVRFPLGITPETYYLFNSVPLPYLCIGCVGFGFALSFIFSSYEGSIGKSILESCKNIISMLLGVVNVFSDIVSYIRLWAVALAGGAIAMTVNEMVGPMLGHAVMFIFGVMILVFGHGLNMVLNILSVIVHGLRLNTLEFSSHLGMSWTGFKYRPFQE